jgi:cation:H+ antiporter
VIINLVLFSASLAVLLFSAKVFTNSAEKIGSYMGMPSFVIGVFIVGIGTSLPELFSGIISVKNGVSEILSGNIIGANISNILLITGFAVVLNRKTIVLRSNYIYIDLHFLLGSFLYFYIIAFDGIINLAESAVGILIFIIYSIYLIRGNNTEIEVEVKEERVFPARVLLILIAGGVGIYFGASFTVQTLGKIAEALNVPSSIIALTLLSLGTTLPELAVNYSAIRQGKGEIALGNTLGSCVFNTLVIPPVCALIGRIDVPADLVGFSLPLMAACGLLFYLLTQDKRISLWEGLMLMCLYVLFLIKVSALA